MKPASKSLEIVVVGLGQAGGNLAAEMTRRGYRSLALNTATTDLDALGRGALRLPDEARLYIGIEGYDGAGADLNYGRECLEANAEHIRERVGELAEGADLVLLVAGFGGGTGSGLSVLVTPGHVPYHQSVVVRGGGDTALFLGDLAPTSAHLPLPWIMGYDLDPLTTLETKRDVLGRASAEGWLLLFEHDPEVLMGRAVEGSRGLELADATITNVADIDVTGSVEDNHFRCSVPTTEKVVGMRSVRSIERRHQVVRKFCHVEVVVDVKRTTCREAAATR